MCLLVGHWHVILTIYQQDRHLVIYWWHVTTISNWVLQNEVEQGWCFSWWKWIIHSLVGRVIDMFLTSCNVGQMLWNFKKDMAVWTPVIRKSYFFVCRVYQRMTWKNKLLALYLFYCIFEFFTMSGVEHRLK